MLKWGNDSKIELKGISKSLSKNIKFDDYKKCLDGSEYQKECDDFNIRSLQNEMYLQNLCKISLSVFDDKSCYESTIKSKPWI